MLRKFRERRFLKVGITLTRRNLPAVIPELDSNAQAVVADFGAFQDIVFDCIFSEFNPSWKLSIELPRNMKTVETQKPDLSYDSRDPLYTFESALSS